MADWRRSSRSKANGNCVEAGAWRKSSRSSTYNGCVEAGTGPAGVCVRDSKDPGGPVLTFSAGAWKRWTARLKRDVAR